jgi:hypothetical protein
MNLELRRRFFFGHGGFTRGSCETPYPAGLVGESIMVTVINTAILAAAICLAIAGVHVLRGPKRK